MIVYQLRTQKGAADAPPQGTLRTGSRGSQSTAAIAGACRRVDSRFPDPDDPEVWEGRLPLRAQRAETSVPVPGGHGQRQAAHETHPVGAGSAGAALGRLGQMYGRLGRNKVRKPGCSNSCAGITNMPSSCSRIIGAMSSRMPAAFSVIAVGSPSVKAAPSTSAGTSKTYAPGIHKTDPLTPRFGVASLNWIVIVKDAISLRSLCQCS